MKRTASLLLAAMIAVPLARGAAGELNGLSAPPVVVSSVPAAVRAPGWTPP